MAVERQLSDATAWKMITAIMAVILLSSSLWGYRQLEAVKELTAEQQAADRTVSDLHRQLWRLQEQVTKCPSQ